MSSSDPTGGEPRSELEKLLERVDRLREQQRAGRIARGEPEPPHPDPTVPAAPEPSRPSPTILELLRMVDELGDLQGAMPAVRDVLHRLSGTDAQRRRIVREAIACGVVRRHIERNDYSRFLGAGLVICPRGWDLLRDEP